MSVSPINYYYYLKMSFNPFASAVATTVVGDVDYGGQSFKGGSKSAIIATGFKTANPFTKTPDNITQEEWKKIWTVSQQMYMKKRPTGSGWDKSKLTENYAPYPPRVFAFDPDRNLETGGRFMQDLRKKANVVTDRALWAKDPYTQDFAGVDDGTDDAKYNFLSAYQAFAAASPKEDQPDLALSKGDMSTLNRAVAAADRKLKNKGWWNFFKDFYTHKSAETRGPAWIKEEAPYR